ncbi:MAG: helix-turn-helix domain containing protein [Nioella sp.]|nr:helix-turn-helix domain containing protein [Nioella sp.]
MTCETTVTEKRRYPAWLPEGARNYLDHTGNGASVRQIARATHRHPSTIARRIRAYEARRDDPLVDEALAALQADCVSKPATIDNGKEPEHMTAPLRPPLVSDDTTVNREARRILRRLCETEATLVLARDMDKAIVLRTGVDGSQTRTAVLDRKVAQAFALKDWIATARAGRVSVYTITEAGKSALKRLIEADRKRRRQPQMEMAEAATPFLAQHQLWGEKPVRADDGTIRKMRVNLAESPLATLARRKGKDGRPFMTMDLVQAGEKLREDFERAQMGPRVAQNWEKFLTGGDRGSGFSDGGMAEGPRAARDRVTRAVDDMGPGLADVVLRVCCFLEGLESAEKRLGWSARSGKIVLKIGLQRLLKHYETVYGFVPASLD